MENEGMNCEDGDRDIHWKMLIESHMLCVQVYEIKSKIFFFTRHFGGLF